MYPHHPNHRWEGWRGSASPANHSSGPRPGRPPACDAAAAAQPLPVGGAAVAAVPVFVGPSPHRNVKKVQLPGLGLAVSPQPANPQQPGWRDRFATQVEGCTLTVRRVDGGQGWGQQLVLHAMPAAADADASGGPVASCQPWTPPQHTARGWPARGHVLRPGGWWQGEPRPPPRGQQQQQQWRRRQQQQWGAGSAPPAELPLPAEHERRRLVTGVFGVRQSWSQVPQGTLRPVFVHVPEPSSSSAAAPASLHCPFPVFVVLHGRGGNGQGALRMCLKHLPEVAAACIVVAPSGFRSCWNVSGEDSLAPDVAFVEAVLRRVCAHANARDRGVTVMGTSNGSGLLNNFLIQSRDPRVAAGISEVSQLTTAQFHDGCFWLPGDDRRYSTPAPAPLPGRRLLLLSGEQDPTIPYGGGPSRIVGAGGDAVSFLPAQESAFVWAQAMGVRDSTRRASGRPYEVSEAGRAAGAVEEFAYLGGAVQHFKFEGMRHNLTHPDKPSIICDFLFGPGGVLAQKHDGGGGSGSRDDGVHGEGGDEGASGGTACGVPLPP